MVAKARKEPEWFRPGRTPRSVFGAMRTPDGRGRRGKNVEIEIEGVTTATNSEAPNAYDAGRSTPGDAIPNRFTVVLFSAKSPSPWALVASKFAGGLR